MDSPSVRSRRREDAKPLGGSHVRTPALAETEGLPKPRSLLSDNRQLVVSDAAVPHLTAGQFSFAPATQQTTITTTTTTTVSLAPLMIRPPQDLLQRDPKQYPLAFSPTPASMKRFGFELAGRSTLYQEAEEADEFVHRYDEQQAELQASNGQIRNEETAPELGNIPSRPALMRPPHPEFQTRTMRPPLKRVSSPPSLAEAAEIASLHRKRKRPRSLLSHLEPKMPEKGSTNTSSARTSMYQNDLSPVTPDTDTGSARVSALTDSGNLPRNNRLNDLVSSRALKMPTLGTTAAQDAISNCIASASTDDYLSARSLHLSGAAATPPIQENDLEPVDDKETQADEQPRLAPASLINSSQQDASLPSPSLSPVTAAANLARSQANAFNNNNVDEDETASEVSRLDGEEGATDQKLDPSFESIHQSNTENSIISLRRTSAKQAASQPTLMDIPDMIRSFDAMPDELQNYVMFQMLKRCSKKTLHTVADVVNPALKCDPFNILPVELGLQITKHLDGKSLCRAAQVSKRWRYLINSDEKAWKDLLDRDGFTLPEGEIERAVREGWGWQFPGPDGFEANIGSKRISRLQVALPEADLRSPTGGLSSDEATSSTSARTTRLKRKATSQAVITKRQKRKVSGQEENSHWRQELERAQGPIAYASAAAKAVPNPNVGLPSLSCLHLFKSIYQRHYMIRNGWINQECQPHHLAFRAHHRHVVTCLLFDADRIITGSDDTSINVYDTKTGVLRKKLEGHEGGVWALNADGNTLVSGSTDRSVRVWDITTGTCMQTFQGHTSTVRCLVILKPTDIGPDADGAPQIFPEEPIIITGSRDSTLRVWRLPQPGDPTIHQAGPPGQNGRDNPYALQTLSGHHNSVRAIAAHGNTLVSGSYDCTVRVWKISTGDLVHRLQGHAQKVYSVVLDHERGRCISGSMDNLVKVWSLDTGVCLFNLEGHTSLVGLLDLSHNYLVSAAADSTLRIWDPENGNCRATLSAHTGAITCFQHDGQKVISGSDRTLKMWNVETGECVRDLLTDLSGVWQVRFDERRCVAAVQRNNLTYIEVSQCSISSSIPSNKLTQT